MRAALLARCCGLLLCLYFLPAQAARYTITEVGHFGDTFFTVTDINDRGQVVGSFAPPGAIFSHTFLWHPRTGLTDLGLFGVPYALQSDGIAINNRGQIAGNLLIVNFLIYIWEAGRPLIVIGGFGGASSIASDINERGQVVGGGRLGDYRWHALLWTPPDQIRDLGTLGGQNSGALGTNNLGQVVGWAELADGATHAVLWQPPRRPLDLGTLGGSWGYATAINDRGQVVGLSYLAGNDYPFRPFLWEPAGGMRALGSLGGNGAAADINFWGQVVGWSLTASGEQRAFLWTSRDGMVDLNILLPPHSGWTLESATDINNLGQIIGVGLNPQGQRRAFLLTPAPRVPLPLSIRPGR